MIKEIENNAHFFKIECEKNNIDVSMPLSYYSSSLQAILTNYLTAQANYEQHLNQLSPILERPKKPKTPSLRLSRTEINRKIQKNIKPSNTTVGINLFICFMVLLASSPFFFLLANIILQKNL